MFLNFEDYSLTFAEKKRISSSFSNCRGLPLSNVYCSLLHFCGLVLIDFISFRTSRLFSVHSFDTYLVTEIKVKLTVYTQILICTQSHAHTHRLACYLGSFPNVSEWMSHAPILPPP